MVALVVQHSKQVRGVLVHRRSMALTLHKVHLAMVKVGVSGE
jgi:hypothetical protein